MKSAKTKQALSSLDWAIAQTVGEPRHVDEFTCAEFMTAGGGNSRAAAASRLNRMVTDGMLTKRPFSMDGSSYTLYRKAD